MFDIVLNEFLGEIKLSTLEGVSEETSCKLLWKFVENGGLQDDLLFFVAKTTNIDDLDPQIQVCRYISNQRPSLNINVAWRESLALNLICHMNFKLRISSCSYKEGEMMAGICHLVVEESTSKKVFASPLEEHLDKFYGSIDSSIRGANQLKKSSKYSSKYSFPEIYFTVQDYETCFENICLGPEGILIVELYIDGDDEHEKEIEFKLEKESLYEKVKSSTVIFQGAITSKVLSGAYHKNIKEFGKTKGSFITMSGPEGIGEAQLHAIDSNSFQDFEEIATKNLRTMKQFLFGRPRSDKRELSINSADEQYYNCRLRFIKLHWKRIIEIFLNKKEF